MAQHANLLGTGLGGAGAAEIAMVAAAQALGTLTKKDLNEVSRGVVKAFSCLPVCSVSKITD